MKIGEVAKRLSVSTDIVRYAANSYSEYMSASAGGQIKGAKRQFNERDCQVIATILKLRDQGLAPEQISRALKTIDLEPCPDLPDPAEQAARESVALVAQPEYERALDRIRLLEQDLENAKAERNRALETWQGDITRLNDRIADLEHQLGNAEGELQVLKEAYKPSDIWLRRLLWAVILTAALTAALIGAALLLAARS